MRDCTIKWLIGGMALSAVRRAALCQAPAPSQEGVDTFTITANTREERLQDVPAAATVVNSRQLDQQNVTDMRDLQRALPAFNNTGTATFSIRGIGSPTFTLSAEGSVGMLLDGVSLGGSTQIPP